MADVAFDIELSGDEIELTYVVMVASFRGKWLFVRHRERGGIELPAGKIRKNESAEEAARRELYEETGANDFTLKKVSIYRVRQDDYEGFGMLFYASITNLGKIPDTEEVEGVELFDDLPENLNYADIQSRLFTKVMNSV